MVTTVKYKAELPEDIEQQMVFDWTKPHPPKLGTRGGFHGLYIELKAVGGKPTPAQLRFLDGVSREGYFAVLCVGHEAAQKTILSYLESEGGAI